MAPGGYSHPLKSLGKLIALRNISWKQLRVNYFKRSSQARRKKERFLLSRLMGVIKLRNSADIFKLRYQASRYTDRHNNNLLCR